MKNQKPQKKISQKELQKRRLNYFLVGWLKDIERTVKGEKLNDRYTNFSSFK